MKLPKAFLDEEKGLVNVVVETPKGSRNKFAFDKHSWLFRLKKILPSGLVFPLDFGFVPRSEADDGDPIDVLVVVEQGTYPGCLLECCLIGIIEGEQTEKDGKTERNDRLLAVPEASVEYANLRDIAEFSREHLNDLAHFFVYYNAMEGKSYKLLGTEGPDEAWKAIKKALK
jgi:inorganic pyrophosphatase